MPVNYLDFPKDSWHNLFYLTRYPGFEGEWMRITGGIYRGRKITVPKGIIKPAMDRMRESMFSILGNLDELSFLDLFCGSGIVGIEAASRGAGPIVLVEKDPGKRQTILKNISFVEVDIRLFTMTAQKYIRIHRDPFDIIFLDPPFPLQGKPDLVASVGKSGILKESGIVMIHHPSEETWEEEIEGLIQYDRRTYGRSILLFYRRKEES